jgi:hypothetical protein
VGTICITILNVSETLKENRCQSQRKDKDLQLSFVLQREIRTYKNDNPKEKQQQAIPACNIAEITKNKQTELQTATLQLTIASFFGMRSCECVKVSQQEK